MAKKNNYITRLQVQKAAEMARVRSICIQQCKDMLLIAASNAFDFGVDDLKRLADEYDATFEEFAQMVVADAKDDKDIWWSTGKCEERLQEILGEHYVTREERYCE